MRHALVTGANGFIGSHLCRYLLARGYRVRGLVRRTSNLDPLEAAPIEYAFGDLTDPAGLARALDRVELVFHLAGITRGRSRTQFEHANVHGTRTLLQACVEQGRIERFVFVSSLAAVGPSPHGEPLIEETEPRPVGPYGVSKLAAERICRVEAPPSLPVTIVRPAAVYGPWENDFYTLFRYARRGLAPRVPGDTRSSLIHVHDLVDLLERAGRIEAAAGRTYFAADPEPYWMRDIQRLIGGALDRRLVPVVVPPLFLYPVTLFNELLLSLGLGIRVLTLARLRDLSQRFWIVDVSAAQRELEWQPAIQIGEGIRDTVSWYREHGWL